MLISRGQRHFAERQNAAGTKVISPDPEFKKIVSLTSSGKREENAVRMSAMERCSKKKYIRVNFCFRPMIATMLQPLL
jgi:hypothetical protein